MQRKPTNDRTSWLAASPVVILSCAILLTAALVPWHSHASTGEMASLSSDDYDEIDPNLNARRTAPEQVLEGSGKKPESLPSAAEMRIAGIQILLDRAGFSPGAINGISSPYLERLIGIHGRQAGIDLTGQDAALEDALEDTGGEAFETIVITNEDIRGPFVADIPTRIQDQASLRRLSFRRVSEAIAERHHMDEMFLLRLNPGVDFTKTGSKITVANIGRYLDRRVSRIQASMHLRQVTAFDNSGEIVAIYPASIGSLQNPSPAGVFKVRNKAGNPAYTLAPDNGFEPIDDGRQVVVAPGPNNPVGIAWIGLSKKTYGIHGTPEPSLIGRAESHGCIRLTNWDALELTRLVSTGVEVVIE